MSDFFRFPQTPHLAWLGPGQPRDDKVLSPDEVDALLAGEVVLEEKVDGANIGFSVSEEGELRIQNRGNYLDPEHVHPQFRPLWPWLTSRESALIDALWPNLMLFGEWCFAVHSVEYDRLDDWFLGFDVYDREAGGFWDTPRRNALLAEIDLRGVPCLAKGHFSMEQLRLSLLEPSREGSGPLEGIVVRRESEGLTVARAKLVRAEFTQTIDEHWSRRTLRRNELADGTTWA